jgi:outer membrane protein OmpA-like peptidoglycan-associated protein
MAGSEPQRFWRQGALELVSSVTMRMLVLLVALLSARSAVADKRVPIHVGYDAEHLDLDKHVLEFKPSRPVAEASLVVIGEDGDEIGKGAATYEHASAAAWWSIAWTQPEGSRVMILKLRVAAADGVATNVELIPWSVSIDHEDVNFRTDLAVIDADERAKLDASLTKIEDVAKRAGKHMKLTLYIAGHTDTVGAAAKNRKLSLERAISIGQYFRTKKLAIPIVVAGFGEEVLKVRTAADTDERANRRADYVLGPAGGTPPFRGPYLKVKADWKPLKPRP